MIKTNYEIIKGIVESKSNCKDLSEKGQYKGLSLTRCVYYQLCKDYMGKKYSHTDAAKTINRDHNNSCYGLRSFKKFNGQEFFWVYVKIYVDCTDKLKELETRINREIELTY